MRKGSDLLSVAFIWEGEARGFATAFVQQVDSLNWGFEGSIFESSVLGVK